MNGKGFSRQNTPAPTALLRKAKQWGVRGGCITHIMREFDEALKDLKANKLLRELVTINPSNSSNAHIFINKRQYVNFSSNDYLGLSANPGIVSAAANALKKYGFGSGASRLLSGTYSPHKELENRIARFKKTEAALIFNSGYAANTGIIPAIAGTETVVFSDELNHASIVDGIRLSRARSKIYKHKDMDHLESLLNKTSRKKLIVTDTVFSMDGDITPLKKLYALSRKYKAMLMIDDAHGTGVLGKTGRGALEHFGIKAANIIQMGTFSKAFGCTGGFAAGSRTLINLLINRARSFIYSTSLPPAVAGAAVKAVDIIDKTSVSRRKKLWKNRERLVIGLQNLGYNTLDSETPIVPIFAGDIKTAMSMGKYLYKQKIFVPAIRPPTVPEGKCRIRFSVTSAHTNKDIDLVLTCLRKYKTHY